MTLHPIVFVVGELSRRMPHWMDTPLTARPQREEDAWSTEKAPRGSIGEAGEDLIIGSRDTVLQYLPSNATSSSTNLTTRDRETTPARPRTLARSTSPGRDCRVLIAALPTSASRPALRGREVVHLPVRGGRRA